MHNLLTDPLIRVRLADGKETAYSLPEVLATLSSTGIASFRGLQPHQKHAWYAFLVQLGAIASHKAQVEELPDEPETWHQLLSALTPEYNGSPWTLIVPDLTQPAFLQPPVPEGTLGGFKDPYAFPDQIDILLTTMGHDIKMIRIREPEADHWMYALITLQTMQGYSGGGGTLNGISRMNGGLGNRPCVGIVPNLDWGTRFRRDVRVLYKTRETLLGQEFGYRDENGIALVWLEPWDGTSSLPLNLLDPYYIEICRRVRLLTDESRIAARTMPAPTARLAAKEQKGVMGDPWTPTDVKDKKSLTVPVGGFRYDRLQRILFSSDYRPSVCQKINPQDTGPELAILARCMVRGQGKTEGFYERFLPIPKEARKHFVFDIERADLARRTKERVEDVATLMKKALRPALLDLIQGGPEKQNRKDNRTDTWQAAFTQRIDDIFFSELWETLEQPQEDARRAWRQTIEQIGLNILHEAERALPVPTARRYRAVAIAERTYRHAMTKYFGREEDRGATTNVG